MGGYARLLLSLAGAAIGVLLAGHKKNAYWYGSQLSIEETRDIAPYQNATGLQVSSAVLAGTAEARDGLVIVLSGGNIDPALHARVEEHLRIYPRRWIAIGLLLALATGLGSLFFGYPFLTSHTAHFTLPLFGEIHLPSAFFFDLGVFAVVVGATLLMLTAIAHQSLRARRRPGAATPGEVA